MTLGTPHHGSYSPAQAFRGVHSVVRKVAALDLRHNQQDLAGIFGTFPGLLEMMPSPRHRPVDLFDPAARPEEGPRPDEHLLRAAGAAQAALPPLGDPDVLPPLPGLDGPRAVLVVGRGSETVVAARRVTEGGRDEFVYDLSTDGDGTVPLDLALVPGLPAYATSAGHGGMPNSREIARVVDNLLATGMTRLLPRLDQEPLRGRRAPRYRSVSDRELSTLGTGEEMARGNLGVRGQRQLLEELVAPLGVEVGTMPAGPLLSVPAEAPLVPAGASARPRTLVVGRRLQRRFELTLSQASIAEAEADAYVLGVFRNVAPAGAASAIDAKLGGALADLVARRMVAGGVGEVTSLPVGRHRWLHADTLLLAGLGAIDTHGDEVLRAVGESVMRVALLSRLDDFAVVPIGAGSGSRPATAVANLLEGFVRALQGAEGTARLRGITICERDPSVSGRSETPFTASYARRCSTTSRSRWLSARLLPRPAAMCGQTPLRSVGSPRSRSTCRRARRSRRTEEPASSAPCSLLVAPRRSTAGAGPSRKNGC